MGDDKNMGYEITELKTLIENNVLKVGDIVFGCVYERDRRSKKTKRNTPPTAFEIVKYYGAIDLPYYVEPCKKKRGYVVGFIKKIFLNERDCIDYYNDLIDNAIKILKEDLMAYEDLVNKEIERIQKQKI